jgi:hypothetical protein
MMMRSQGTRQRIWIPAILIFSISVFAPRLFSAQQAPASAEIPVVKGGAGSCSADFVVANASGQGVYNAKIVIQLKYGFMGLHRLDATVSTNFDGKARIEGLPQQIRKTAEFTVSLGEQSKTLPFDPLNECNARHDVTLGGK